MGTPRSASAELYNPDLGSWSNTASMNASRTEHFATRLNDTQVLVGGGWNGTALPYFSSSEIGSFVPANHLTGTLILPSGWITRAHSPMQLSGDYFGRRGQGRRAQQRRQRLGRMDWLYAWSVQHQDLGDRLRRRSTAG